MFEISFGQTLSLILGVVHIWIGDSKWVTVSYVGILYNYIVPSVHFPPL